MLLRKHFTYHASVAPFRHHHVPWPSIVRTVLSITLKNQRSGASSEVIMAGAPPLLELFKVKELYPLPRVPASPPTNGRDVSHDDIRSWAAPGGIIGAGPEP